MKILLDFKTENAAFEEPAYEIERLMDYAKRKILDDSNLANSVQDERWPLVDTNGNTIGNLHLIDDPCTEYHKTDQDL